jgi:hypothetical protein
MLDVCQERVCILSTMRLHLSSLGQIRDVRTWRVFITYQGLFVKIKRQRGHSKYPRHNFLNSIIVQVARRTSRGTATLRPMDAKTIRASKTTTHEVSHVLATYMNENPVPSHLAHATAVCTGSFGMGRTDLRRYTGNSSILHAYAESILEPRVL